MTGGAAVVAVSPETTLKQVAELMVVEVAVKDGEVLLSGEVDTATNARLVEFFSSRVPGVVAVRSDLRPRDAEGPAL